jgi:homeodomain-containing protein
VAGTRPAAGACNQAARPRLTARSRRGAISRALRHQLAVLARSDRRFRPGDRLLWLCLRRLWHRWKEALVLVEPATVSRWHRQGFAGCWRRRSRRRPGRPRVDSEVHLLIRRMATSNCLWGAPRIHGELLKLGISVSERTVSRYMPDRMKPPTQSWRTFLANQFGQLTFASTVTPSDAPGFHDVADARACRFVPPSLHSSGFHRCRSHESP